MGAILCNCRDYFLAKEEIKGKRIKFVPLWKWLLFQ